MKKTTTLLALIFSIACFAQSYKTVELDSKQLGKKRTIKIYIPASYEQDSTRVYPMAVVLDGNYLFDTYVGNSILFSQKDKAPEQIVVGIEQPGDLRYIDCSYNKANSLPVGSSDSFYRFVRAEVLNYMHKNYRVSPFKTIVGNTLTANFSNYFLIEDEPGFNAFICINPYYAPNMPSLLSNEVKKIKKKTFYYYLSSGDYLSDKKQTSINNLSKLLTAVNSKKFNYKFEDLSGSTSVSSIGKSVSGAFAFVFDSYSSISKEEYETKIQDLSPIDAIYYVEDKYKNIQTQFGIDLKVRMKDIYAIEALVIEKENGEYLRDLGELVYNNYPDSPLSEYYIGLDYEMHEKYKQAAEVYQEGYMKIQGNPQLAGEFYKNVERAEQKLAEEKSARNKRNEEDYEDEYQDDEYQDDEYQDEPEEEITE